MFDEKDKIKILAQLYVWFTSLPEEDQKEFRECHEEDLIRYHHGFGTYIRNKYLWNNVEWEPEVHDGTDYSRNHPDAISQEIIRMLWRKIQHD